MKYLVAPDHTKQGVGELDFCHTTPGEPLTIPNMRCDSGFPEDECGCHRSLSGVNSRKATTMAIVGDVAETVVEIAIKDATGFTHQELKDVSPELLASALRNAVLLQGIAQSYSAGTRLAIKHNDGKANSFTGIEPAGTFGQKFGV